MSVTSLIRQISTQQTRILKCPGLATDLAPATVGTTLYTISGDPILVHYLFGVVSTVIGAGLARPFLQLTCNAAYGGTVVPMCALSASIATDAVGTVYTWDGTAAGLLTPKAVVGIKSTAEATGVWGPATGAGDFIILVPGIIQIVNTVSAVTGVIDWYLGYEPGSSACQVTVR
jgi:hypothetical protein